MKYQVEEIVLQIFCRVSWIIIMQKRFERDRIN